MVVAFSGNESYEEDFIIYVGKLKEIKTCLWTKECISVNQNCGQHKWIFILWSSVYYSRWV